jgi:hypothetical protein
MTSHPIGRETDRVAGRLKDAGHRLHSGDTL